MFNVPGSTPNTRNLLFLLHLEDGFVAGAAACVTEIETVLIALPSELTAVSLYVAGAVSDTLLVPVAETVPIPWSIVTVVALVTFHERTVVAPVAIEAGTAEN
jgi:hypothetical protein